MSDFVQVSSAELSTSASQADQLERMIICTLARKMTLFRQSENIIAL